MYAWIVSLVANPWLMVGLGGAIGCNARYNLSLWQKRFDWSGDWPIATTIANLFGSLMIGVIAAKVQDRGSISYLFLAVGFCGGLTTFSSLAMELIEHLQKGRWDRFVSEALLNFVFGLFFCYLGWKLFAGPTVPQ